MSVAVSLLRLAMSPMSLSRLDLARLRREAHEAVNGEDVRLRGAKIRGQDGREEYLGRSKRAPVAPTIPSRQREGMVEQQSSR